MERNPKDKVVVITGGASGIGYQIANHFLKNGSKTVILTDINEAFGDQAVKTLKETYGDGKAIFIKCDVTKDLEAVSSQIFKNYQVDVLVNNAGILDELALRKTLEINCVAVVEWGMKFWEYMRKDKGGRGGTIYNVASIYSYEYSPWIIYYKTSKYAALGFSRTLGHPYNYEKTGVRVIAICPGFTDTPLHTNIWDFQKEDFRKVVKEAIIQSTDTVGKDALEIFKVADTGSAWVSRENKPIHLAPIEQQITT